MRNIKAAQYFLYSSRLQNGLMWIKCAKALNVHIELPSWSSRVIFTLLSSRWKNCWEYNKWNCEKSWRWWSWHSNQGYDNDAMSPFPHSFENKRAQSKNAFSVFFLQIMFLKTNIFLTEEDLLLTKKRLHRIDPGINFWIEQKNKHF